MKYLIPALLFVAMLAPAVSEAGPIRNILGRGKAAAGKVLRRASHPFGGCANGACR